MRLRDRFGIVAPLVLACSLVMPALGQDVTTPSEHLGRELGADFTLADWQEVSSYYRLLGQQSPSVITEKVGTTTEGRDFLISIISSATNLANLDQIKAHSKTLADPRGKSDAQLHAAIMDGKVILFISCQMHSTEAAGSQFGMQFAYDLATSNDGNVYVAFQNATQLAEPKGSAELLKQMRAQEGPIDKNKPVIDKGQAFSPAYDQARRDTFMNVTNESFKQVFESEGLLNLVPLVKGDDRDDKIIFEVSSKIIRVNEYFRFTNNKIFAGFLFAIEVEWDFKIFGRDGKTLYAPKARRSGPSDNVQVASGPNDPDWAMYSVMMDSCYYNYSREMTGHFGLTPPPVKTQFSYTTPVKGKSLR